MILRAFDEEKPMTWMGRFVRSTWWLVLSGVIPILVAGAGAIYIARELGAQKAEIVRLNAELHACMAR